MRNRYMTRDDDTDVGLLIFTLIVLLIGIAMGKKIR